MIAPYVLIVGVPAIILSGTFWVALNHRLVLLAPFLFAVVLLANLVRIAGLSPLVFFVSPGGWLWFFGLSWVAAAVVRVPFELWHRRS